MRDRRAVRAVRRSGRPVGRTTSHPTRTAPGDPADRQRHRRPGGGVPTINPLDGYPDWYMAETARRSSSASTRRHGLRVGAGRQVHRPGRRCTSSTTSPTSTSPSEFFYRVATSDNIALQGCNGSAAGRRSSAAHRGCVRERRRRRPATRWSSGGSGSSSAAACARTARTSSSIRTARTILPRTTRARSSRTPAPTTSAASRSAARHGLRLHARPVEPRARRPAAVGSGGAAGRAGRLHR